jgi:hypothetical protein
VDKKLKLILGLIWTLILHYSISMPMWEGEEPTPSEGGPTPKQRLLNWIQSKVPDLPIKNFTTDWNDGRAIGALVDAVGPGQCPVPFVCNLYLNRNFKKTLPGFSVSVSMSKQEFQKTMLLELCSVSKHKFQGDSARLLCLCL